MREVEEGSEGGTYVYPGLIHADVWQKPTQFCKAIILQFKITKLKYIQKNVYKINKLKYIQISNNSALKPEKGKKALRNRDPHGCLLPSEFWFYHLLPV